MPKHSVSAIDNIAVASITAATAAAAAGVDLKRFQRIVFDAREWVLGDADRLSGQWRRYAPVDVVRIAVIARLLPWGFTLTEAREILAATLDRFLGGMALYRDVPLSFMVAQVCPLRIQIARIGGRIVAEPEGTDRSTIGAHVDSLFVDVGAIADAIYRRLKAAAIPSPASQALPAGASPAKAASGRRRGRIDASKAATPATKS